MGQWREQVIHGEKFRCFLTDLIPVVLCVDDHAASAMQLSREKTGLVNASVLVQIPLPRLKIGYARGDILETVNVEARKRGEENEALVRFYSKDDHDDDYTFRSDVAVLDREVDEIDTLFPASVPRMPIITDDDFAKHVKDKDITMNAVAADESISIDPATCKSKRA